MSVFKITPNILTLVEDISEQLGHWSVLLSHDGIDSISQCDLDQLPI